MKLLFLLEIFLLVTVSRSSPFHLQDSINSNKTLTSLLLQELKDGPKQIQRFTTALVRLSENLQRNDFYPCINDLKVLLSAIKDGEPRAFEILDSFGKFKETMRFPGSQSVCIRDKSQSFPTQYCNLKMMFKPQFLSSVKYGLCLPISCSEEIFNPVLSSFDVLVTLPKFKPPFLELECYNGKKLWSDMFFIVSLVLSTGIVILTIAGTICEMKNVPLCKVKTTMKMKDTSKESSTVSNDDGIVFSRRTKSSLLQFHELNQSNQSTDDERKDNRGSLSPVSQLLMCFSVYQNGKRLFSFKTTGEEISCLNGIRALSITWIIYGHSLIFGMITDNPVSFIQYTQILPFNLLINAPFAVNSFVVLSGILVAYRILKADQKGIKINWSFFYIQRFLRISGTYWFYLYVVYWGVFTKLTQGPTDTIPEYDANACEINWWRNLLYINNFFPIREMCSSVTWYLAVDMQLYLISPVFLSLFFRNEYLALLVSGIAIAVSGLVSFSISLQENFKYGMANLDIPTFISYIFDLHVLEVLYIRPYLRLAAYVTGICCGWLIFKIRNKFQLNKLQVIVGWCLSMLLILPIMFILYSFQLSVLQTAFYILYYTSVWSFGLCLLIVLCSTGFGGIINTILSWRGWSPFSRLAFDMYLVHPLVIHFIFFIIGKINHFTFLGSVVFFFTSLQLTIMAAVILHLTVEAPFLRLQNLLIMKKT